MISRSERVGDTIDVIFCERSATNGLLQSPIRRRVVLYVVNMRNEFSYRFHI